MDCNKLTSITIPDSVTYIDNEAFEQCTGLTSITIPGSVESIREAAFSGCTNLTDITLNNGLTDIEAYAFSDCGITEITIPDSVSSLVGSAFVRCSSLKTINISEDNNYYKFSDGVLFDKNMTCVVYCPCSKEGEYVIPDSVTSIGSGAFMDCNKLISVVIPDSVTSIEDHAFYGCTGLTDIIIPNGVTEINAGTFYYCTGLTSISIPNGVTSIYGSAFSNCFQLESVTIPNTVTMINWYAFANCMKLTSVVIPNSVTEIDYDIFSGCSGLKEIIVDENNKNYKSVDGVLFNKDMTEIISYPDGKQGEYSIPTGVVSIQEQAFNDCIELTGITIPDSVKEIGFYSFSNCTKLTSITIPDSVKKIEKAAFGYSDYYGQDKIEDFVIFGHSGSEAEKYANENGFRFVDLNSQCEHANNELKNVKTATCTEDGYSGDKYCTDCGELIEKGTAIKATGHKFSDGICTVCGETDPNYKPIENPTETPTEKPTEKPTESPTEKPTEKPTVAIIEPTTKAGEKLEFAANSNVNGKIDEENKKVSIVPSASAGISLDDFKAMFKDAVSVAGEKIENVFNGMKFTFNGNEYTFILKGDASPDGKITAGDARTILRIAAKLEQPDDVTKESADINSDGKVTSSEARNVLRFAEKLQNKIYE